MQKLLLLINSKSFKKYFFNTGWLLSDKLLRVFLGVLVGFWVARFLGPESFGVLSYSQAIITMIAALSNLGLNEILVREFITCKGKENELIGTSVFLRFNGAFAVLLVLFAIFTFNKNETNLIVLILGLSMLFQSLRALNFYFQSLVLGKYVALTSMVSLIGTSIVKIALILFGAPLVLFAWVVVLDSFIISAGLIFFYFKTPTNVKKWNVNFELGKKLIKESWPLILSAILISIYMKIDVIMIKALLDNKAVGNYAAAVKISESWGFIPSSIIASTFPAIINSKKNSSANEYHNRLQKLYSLMIFLAVLVAIPVTIFAPSIISFAYGNEYSQASDVLIIHIWSCVFVFLGGASSKWLLVENLQKYFAVNTAIGALVNIILNYFLIKQFGIKGAAWSTLLSYCIAAYLALILWKKTRPNFFNLTKGFKIYKLFKFDDIL